MEMKTLQYEVEIHGEIFQEVEKLISENRLDVIATHEKYSTNLRKEGVVFGNVTSIKCKEYNTYILTVKTCDPQFELLKSSKSECTLMYNTDGTVSHIEAYYRPFLTEEDVYPENVEYLVKKLEEYLFSLDSELDYCVTHKFKSVKDYRELILHWETTLKHGLSYWFVIKNRVKELNKKD